MEMSTEEILTVSTVNQSLFDTQGSPALEDYFNDKSIKGMWFSYWQIPHLCIVHFFGTFRAQILLVGVNSV